jgi:hypothetical protein
MRIVAHGNPSPSAVINPTLHGIAAAEFGDHVALGENFALIHEQTSKGKVHIFPRNGGAKLATLTPPDTVYDYNSFGSALGQIGQYTFVSSPHTYSPSPHDGKGYIYTQSGQSTFTKTSAWGPTPNTMAGYMGSTGGMAKGLIVMSQGNSPQYDSFGKFIFHSLNKATGARNVVYTHTESSDTVTPGKVAISQLRVGAITQAGTLTTVKVFNLTRDASGEVTAVTQGQTINIESTGLSDIRDDILAMNSSFLVLARRNMTVTSGSSSLTEAGVVDLYGIENGQFALLERISPPSPITGGRFGSAVALVGGTLFVGARGEAGDASRADGAVYVYQISGKVRLLGRMFAPERKFGAMEAFGSSMSADDTGLLVGASKASDVGSGSVYIYEVPAVIDVLKNEAVILLTTQPVAQAASFGENVLLSVAALSSVPVEYQWRKNGLDIDGATASSLSLANIGAGDAASYDVVVTNAAGSVTSSAALLTVNLPPAITTQPLALSASGGASASFSVVATGAGLAYQWRKNGVTVFGATSSSFTISSVTIADEASYDVVITNAGGSVTSSAATLAVNPPSTSAVTFSQRTDGSKLVDVYYTLTGGTSSVALGVSLDGGTTFSSVKTLSGDVGAAVSAGTAKQIVWNAGTDYPGAGYPNVKMRVTALLDGAGGTFAPIPGGTYQMGNLIGDSDITDAAPVTVTLGPYYMAVNDTTKAQWDSVRTWAASNGYTDLAVGAGKAANHPVQMVNWYNVVKWANAASEKEGLTPCYRVSESVVRTGTSNAVVCDWTANGYRLPTEAEWEVAARGGLSGKRFPWGDTISQSQANYRARTTEVYDLSGSVNDFHPAYKTGAAYTSVLND